MAVTQKSYVDSQPAVKKARETLSKAQAALNQAKLALDNTPANLKDLVKSNTAAVKAAQAAVDQAKAAESGAVATAGKYYTENKATIEAEANKGNTLEDKLKALEEAAAKAKAAGVSTAGYEGQIADLKKKIAAAKTGTKTTDTGKTGDNTGVETPAKLRDYASEITTAGRAIAKMTNKDRLAISQALANAGYKVTPSGNYSDALVAAYTQAIADNQIRSTNFNREIPLTEFLTLRKNEGAGADTGVSGKPSTESTVYPTITNEEDGKATINKFFQDKFGRDATPEEFKEAYAAIKADQAKNPVKRVAKRDAQGKLISYTETGGTNTEQFLTDYIAKKPKLAQEAATYEASDVNVLKRQKAKELYDREFAKLNGDAEAIAKLNQSTSYGRLIQSMQNKIARIALEAGAKIADADLAAYAKEAIDTSLDTDAESLTAFINSKLKFGKNAEGRYIGAAGENFDSLAKIASANGLDLEKAFGTQLPDWLTAINKGESIETYKKIIRDVAKIGMPEKIAKLIDQGIDLSAIYAPYKNIMANTLEIPSTTIDMNDPTLRSAITAESEIPLYEFERQLRKDNRWQYTNQAKSEVSSATQKILQDFGFMG